jgi:carbonic anhydrase
MKTIRTVFIYAFLSCLSLHAVQTGTTENTKTCVSKEGCAILQEFFKGNTKHMKQTHMRDFKSIALHQNPRATVVMCCDSRIQTTAFDDTPVNDLFLIRDIGNQISTAAGSVEYGIRHLNTPVLLIIGHSNCGAIKAGMGDFSKETQVIQKELNSLKFDSAKTVIQGVIENVHTQVTVALDRYKDLVDANQLLVVGAVYDFVNEFNKGAGRLLLINVNGETDIEQLKQITDLKTFGDSIFLKN